MSDIILILFCIVIMFVVNGIICKCLFCVLGEGMVIVCVVLYVSIVVVNVICSV